MAVSSVQSTTPVQPQSEAAVDRASLGQDFDQFLRLLTTQLQNQDPLSPMDSTEFTNQLVSFSAVEQSIKQNDQLGKLLAMQALNLTALGVSFIGKDVEISGDTFEKGAMGPVTFSYDMPSDAATGTISIVDEEGQVVWSQAADTAAGRHDLTWDGMDNSNQALDAGSYTVRIGALTAKNAALNVTTYVPGHVDGLESADNGDLLLVVGKNKVPMTEVRKISEPEA